MAGGAQPGDVAWQAIAGLPAWCVTQIPRDARAGSDGQRGDSRAAPGAGDDEQVRRVQALAAAYGTGGPVAFGWVRERPGGPVRVIAAGPGLCAGDGAGSAGWAEAAGWAGGAGGPGTAGGTGTADGGADGIALTLPAGARGEALPAGGAAAVFGAVRCWTPLAIIADPLLAEEDKARRAERAADGWPMLEDGLVAGGTGVFGWLVLAVPVDPGRLAGMVDEVARVELYAERHESPRSRITARRAALRHEELRRAAATGLWRIWLLAGGASLASAARVARVLGASASLEGLPYALAPLDRYGSLAQLLGPGPGGPGPGDGGRNAVRTGAGGGPGGVAIPGSSRMPAGGADPGGAGTAGAVAGGAGMAGEVHGDPVPEFPCAGSVRLLAALARPPAREVPGVRFVLRPEFDVTPEGWSDPEFATGTGGRSDAACDNSKKPDEYGDFTPSRGIRSSIVDDGTPAPAGAGGLTGGAAHGPGAGGVRGAGVASASGGSGMAAAGDGMTSSSDGPRPASPGGGADGVMLGTVLDWARAPAGPLRVPMTSLNRHVFVCGATGAGKSQTVRHLLQAASGAGIPWLVIEPAKAEYRLMAARLPDAGVITIRPGDLDVPPAGLNPLEPERGPDGTRFPLQAHADLVRSLFLAAFEADEPFPQVLSAALSRCYERAGWDLVTGEPAAAGAAPPYPTLRDLQDCALAVVEEIGYSREITDNVRGFVAVRIGSLRLGTAGRFLDGGHRLEFGRLLESNVVLEIEDCGDDADKAFVTGAVLIRLTEHLRLRQRAEGSRGPAGGTGTAVAAGASGGRAVPGDPGAPGRPGTPEGPRASRGTGLRHLTVIEEAHRLLRQPPPGTGSGPAARAVEIFAGLLAEVRAYGEGLVVAEQIPAKLIPDVIKNTAVKIVHRLPAADDREAVGATMNLTSAQSRYLVTLVPGEAAVFIDGMDYPVLARMPDGTAREAAVPARPASPARLVRPRSGACPPECRAALCTLRQIRAAQNAAARDRRLTLWAELSVTAHLLGWRMPMPAADLADGLAAMDKGLRDCALAQATDEAVAARASAVAEPQAGPTLAAHVTTAMRAALDLDQWACEDTEPWWLARPAPVPGQWQAAVTREARAAHAIRFGTRSPSGLECAVGASVGDPDWDRRLSEALGAFSFLDGLRGEFRSPAAESPAGSPGPAAAP